MAGVALKRSVAAMAESANVSVSAKLRMRLGSGIQGTRQQVETATAAVAAVAKVAGGEAEAGAGDTKSGKIDRSDKSGAKEVAASRGAHVLALEVGATEERRPRVAADTREMSRTRRFLW